MKSIKLFLPGRFEDAYIYMGHLVALTENRTLNLYNLDELVNALATQYPDLLMILTLMFLRNDWLNSEQFKLLKKDRGIAKALLSAIESFPLPYLKLNDTGYNLQEQDFKIPANVLLDMSIYNSRLYIGADTGFYHANIEWEKDASNIGKIEKRLDARCLSISARYGAVTASCGDSGLFTGLNEFNWTPNQQKMEMIAQKSVRTGWFEHDLINYSSFTTPSLYQGTYERVASESNRFSRATDTEDRSMLTQISKEQISLDNLFEAVDQKYEIQREMIQYVYNSNSTVFIYTMDGQFYSLGLRHKEERAVPEIRFTKSYKGNNVQILSVSALGNRLCIETNNRILLFANGEWFSLLDSEALSVRTFPRSKRFQNTVVITSEEGIWLIGVFDDSGLYTEKVS